MRQRIGFFLGLTVLLGCCLGAKGCGNSGTGSLIAVGDVPVTVAQPMGVSVRGHSSGLTVWMLGAAASAAVVAAAEAKADHLVGSSANELASSPKDPCRDKSSSVLVAGWKEKGLRVYLDCRQWRFIARNYASQIKNMPDAVQKILTCLENSIRHAVVITIHRADTTIYRWTYGSNMETQIMAETNGRIYATSSTNWEICATAE